MNSANYTLYIASKVRKSSICANICSKDNNISIYYLGTSFGGLLRYIFEGSRYLFEAHCISENRIIKYSLWYTDELGKTFLNDHLNSESCYGYLNFLGQKVFRISKGHNELLKVKIKTIKTKDIFICDNEVLAELFPYSALSHLAMPDFKCFHINVNNIVKFDLRILLSYLIWKIIDKMDIYSCGLD